MSFSAKNIIFYEKLNFFSLKNYFAEEEIKNIKIKFVPLIYFKIAFN